MKNQKRKNATMLSFFQPKDKRPREVLEAETETIISNENMSNHNVHLPTAEVPILNTQEPSTSRPPREYFDTNCLLRDPGLRKPIWEQEECNRDKARLAYIGWGPFQPKLAVYPWSIPTPTQRRRRFKYNWFSKFDWLEYSPSKDRAFCFPCFIFENEEPRYSTFTVTGFNGWKRVKSQSCPLLIHMGMGCPTSIHMNAVRHVEALKNPLCHIDRIFNTQSAEEIMKNRLRVLTTVKAIRWLTLQGCALRGHDESSTSENRGNFIELVSLMGDLNDDIGKVVLKNAPKNAMYTSHQVQKEILHLMANKVRESIRAEIGEAKFCILVDEAKDASNKEQMAIVLRFVDDNGLIQEKFFEIVHVRDTKAETLKDAISNVLTRCGLAVKDLRGQGYDGASNMSGAFNGLQQLFNDECQYAYYVHCFAHRLQLALVATAEQENKIWQFFSKLSCIVNLVSVSPKRHTELQYAQAIEVERAIATGERNTGKGANQMGSLHRPGATRWTSHFDSICSLFEMYDSTIEVLDNLSRKGASNAIKGEALGAVTAMMTFDFVFILHLMHKIMGFSNMLCKALQSKSLDIINAMELVATTKRLLERLLKDEFANVLGQVINFCDKHDILVPDMEARYMEATRRSCQQTSNVVHYRDEVFTRTIVHQLDELNSRFSEKMIELLTLSAALDPTEKFRNFNADKIYLLAKNYYGDDFDSYDLQLLKCQLAHFELDVVQHDKFQNMTNISQVCRGLVETHKKDTYNMIDKLLRLILTLPVSTASSERAFSAMKHVKSILRNKMDNEYLTDSMVLYIERDIARKVDLELIVDDFDGGKHRRVPLRLVR